LGAACRISVALLLMLTCAAGEKLTVLSANVWFDDASGEQRYPAILARLAAADPTVICLQECTESFLARLRASPLAQRYRIHPDAPIDGYGNLVLSRTAPAAVGIVRLPSRMGRKAPWIDLPWEGQRVRIFSVHLESLDLEVSVRLRNRQLPAIAAQATAPAMIVGDFNFGDQDTAAHPLPPGFTDAAATLGGVLEPTYDPVRNPLARQTAEPGEPARRLDRFLASAEVKATAYRRESWGLSDHEVVIGEFVLTRDHHGVNAADAPAAAPSPPTPPADRRARGGPPRGSGP
jgi:endonuclease/exonuclease/phosphatase family metal-dependent hydrolase